MNDDWFVYLVRCKDSTLYCGTTNNVQRRLGMHNNKTGAKYTASRTPVELVYSEKCGTQSAACVRECEIKKMTKEQKELLVAGFGND